MKSLRIFAVVLWCAAMPVCRIGANEINLKSGNYDWMKLIRRDHPRMLFNADTFPEVKARALGRDLELFNLLKEQVDALPEHPAIDWDRKKLVEKPDGTLKFIPPSFMLHHCMTTIGGTQAAHCALVFLVTGESKYLDKAKSWLFHSLKVYNWALDHQIMVEWSMKNYPATLLAYDWLYNHLTPDERKNILNTMIRITRAIQSDKRDIGQVATYRRNKGGYQTGFYGDASLRWYTGLAGYGDGIDDAAAKKLLKLGFDDFVKMMDFRDKVSGGDGVLVTNCLMYSFDNYPPISIRFLLLLKSATGINGTKQWRHMGDFPRYVYWNLIPGRPGKRPLEFGIGDAQHTENIMPDTNMGVIMPACCSLYAEDSPETAVYAELVLKNITPNIRKIARQRNALLMLMLNDPKPAASGAASDKISAPADAKFYYFAGAGLAFMRSGNHYGDTFAVMRAGGDISSGNHQHYDEGHFAIYKKGFLALDSGTRARVRNYSLTFYYSQTVAHNAILIHQPGEKIAPYWGEHHLGKYPEPRPEMHGGQYKQQLAKTETRETRDYALVRNDATRCYNPEKCRQAVREFIHLRPDLFLVIDRVESTRAEYKKEWLVHFQNQPRTEGDRWTAVEGEGRLTGQVLYPEKFTLKTVGGPGMEFFASGRNWPLDPKIEAKNIGKLHGNWRLELSPEKAAKFDLFVNLLYAQDRKKPEPLPEIKKSFKNGSLKLEFEYAGKNWQVNIPASGKTTIDVKSL